MKRSHPRTLAARPGRRAVPLFAALLISSAACSGRGDAINDTGTAAPAGEPAAASSRADAPIAFTDADLDALHRGLTKEIELVRAAKARQDSAKTPAERGAAAQAQFETTTIPEAAKAIGVPVERYQQTRAAVGQVLTTLDFQGKIDGPMELDTARASAEAKERLRSDPFAQLAPESAAALRARLDRIAAVWIEYVRLTAVAG